MTWRVWPPGAKGDAIRGYRPVCDVCGVIAKQASIDGSTVPDEWTQLHVHDSREGRMTLLACSPVCEAAVRLRRPR